MKQNILKQAADYSKRRRKEVRRYRVIGVLAAFVVFCTTYALIMPAITMEHPQCGLEEHTHAKACYEDVLVCGLEESEDVGHVHTDACYEVTTEEVLTCTQEVGGHQHTDACYTKETVTKYKTITVEETETVMEETTEMVSVDDYETQVVGQDEEGNDITQSVKVGSHEEPRPVSRPVTKVIGSHEERVEDGTEEVFTLTCGEDVSGHQHGDSCYQTVEHRTLICTETEGTPGHHHTEACYEHKLICTIPEHTHTDACYPEKNGDQSVIEGDQSVIEGEGEQPELPTVDSEGYVIDADGNRVANEDGTYTQYQVGEDGALVLDEDGNPILAEAAEEIIEPVEIDDVTVDGQLYQLVFHVTYNGEQAEGDEFVFTPNVLDIAEDETDRTYEYTSLINSTLIQPMGRTEFALTRNGETVDRSEYAVSVEIIPSRMAMAFLIQSIGGDPMEELNLTEETEDGETVTVTPGFVANEIMGDQLYPAGHIDVDTETLEALRLDLESYMAALYDENGEMNPDALYDTDYAFTAEIQGEDFLMTTGLVEDMSEELLLTQNVWDDKLTVYWDGLADNGSKTGTHPGGSNNNTDHHVTVTMTHSDENGIKDSNRSPVTITHGTGTSSAGWQYKNVDTYKGINLKSSGIYPNATTKKVDYAVLDIEPDEGYYVKKVVIACVQNSKSGGSYTPYGCSIWSDNLGTFQREFDVSRGRHVSLTVSTLNGFCHAGNQGTSTALVYGILVQTAPIPSPLYVKYDAGIMNTNAAFNGFGWLEGGRFTENTNYNNDRLTDEIYKSGDNGTTWASGDLLYTTSGITEQAKTAAREAGYEFAGWQLSYYNVAAQYKTVQRAGWYYKTYDKTNIYISTSQPDEYDGRDWVTSGYFKVLDRQNSNFDNVQLFGVYGSTYGDEGEHKQIELITNAKLTAIWVPNPQLNVTKTVENMTEGIWQSKDYTFKIERTDGTPVTGYTVIETYEENGNIRYREPDVTGNTFTLSVTGNRSSNIRIKGLEEGVEYKITETETQGARPSYTVDGETGNTFTAKGKSETSVSLVVTNDFATPKGFDVTIEKVTPKDNSQNPTDKKPQSINTDAYWARLGGAKFQLAVKETGTTTTPGETGQYKMEYAGEDKGEYYECPDGWGHTHGDGCEKVGDKWYVYVAHNNESRNIYEYFYDICYDKVPVVDETTGGETGGTEFTVVGDEITIEANSTGGPATASAGTLEADKIYRLTETKAPDGYNLLTDPIYFKIENGAVVICDESGAAKDANRNVNASDLTLIVANYGGYVLPSTGGAGTLMYTLGGGMLMMACALVLVYKKTQRKGAREI